MSPNSRLVAAPAEHGLSAPELPPTLSRTGKKLSKVLLLDAYSTRTLACVRSWGKNGVAFAVGGETRWDMSLFSRYTKEKFVYAGPKRDLSKFIQDINRYSDEFGTDCVFPTSEAGIMACSKFRNELNCVPIIPQEEQIETIFSKARTLAIAESLGIPVPKTMRVTNENFARLDAASLNFPVVIKSESSEVMLSTKTSTSGKTSYVFSKSELDKECRSRLDKGQTVLLQEFIDGYGMGISGLFAEGRPVALLGHKRIRESDPLGGPSALAEAIEIEPQMREMTASLLKAIAFTGPAMVEYKVDRRNGRPYLMEINGRFWGSVLLASAAGLDLPYLYWKMLNGMEITPEEKQYRVGTRGRYLVGDTKYLLHCLKGKPDNWPGEFESRGCAVKSYLSSFFDGQTKDLLLTPDDPMPFLARLVQDFA